MTPSPHVWMVDARGRLYSQPVTVGARDVAGNRIEIISGVREGDMVASNPQATFRTGERVRISR